MSQTDSVGSIFLGLGDEQKLDGIHNYKLEEK